ncbi:16S rRNA (cytosine(1402)-N(4))-methyltransferase [Neobacillus sedimentimangrovi]|jgi:16S rRNA C1402 N4-methylase RsmH|uniref:16S rRNA (Cytosine(1402)-N(4))-methyltransferase n=1 Tax=Neobacillus sedimentimangrovi TaxID=2699460 RepID=A0ABS8QJS1_9BACI|nr:class I SAM-dependent methyltransferase [Neobacillus sedimentimangrovi]MCD4839529.1 16S rRNA (cytosine(1402)-N(4))-methyltransferase [Neobacillus sedimentimangrovi]
MKMDRILPFARILLEKAVSPGDIAVDATLGNGHDTVFLAELVGDTGKVYGFDVQEQAVLATKQRLNDHNLMDRAILFHNGHEKVRELIPADQHGKVTGAIFNLGYLPGSDKTIVTQPETTISAIKQLLEIMAPEGIIVLVIYHGHEGGAIERDALLKYCQQLDQKKAHVLQYQFINQQNNPPFIVAIEKR